MKTTKGHPESGPTLSGHSSGSTQVTLATGLKSGDSAPVTLDQDGPWQLIVVGRWNENSNSNYDVAVTLQQSPDNGTTWVASVYGPNGAQTQVSPRGQNARVVSPLMPIDLPSPCLVRVAAEGFTDGATSLSVYMQPLSSRSG